MKKLSACILSAVLLLAACAKEEETPAPTPQPGIRPHVTEPYVAPAIPEEWGEDAERLLTVPWAVVTPGATGDLTFDGEQVHWEVASPDGSVSAVGVPTFSNGVMTVDGVEFRWETLAAYCLLTADGETWRLKRADSVEDAQHAFRLVNGTWSGDGMTLSFGDGLASFTVGDRSLTGAWSLASDGSLTIRSDAAGFNLARGAAVTTTSMETPDFPPELAFDGDLSTRYSSAYNDPIYVTADLGKTCKIGCAVLYFETAYSSEFKIEVSSGSDVWTEAAHVRGNTQSGIEQPVTVPFKKTVEARQVRFVGLKRGTDWGHSFYELELYEIAPGEVEMSVYTEGETVYAIYEGNTYRLTREP